MIRWRLQGSGATGAATGATQGQEDIRGLRDCLVRKGGPSAKGEIVILDFGAIPAATASYIKATVLFLLQCAKGSLRPSGSMANPADPWEPVPIDIYPMVTTVSPEVAEELAEVLRSRDLVCLETVEEDGESVRSARMHGELDPTLRKTLRLLLEARAATATDLREAHPGDGVNTTAWNNRLADLHRLRLVTRSKCGRHWVYEPIVGEIVNG